MKYLLGLHRDITRPREGSKSEIDTLLFWKCLRKLVIVTVASYFD